MVNVNGHLAFESDTFLIEETFSTISVGTGPSAKLDARPGTVLTNLPHIVGYDASSIMSVCTPGAPCAWLFRDSVGLDVYSCIEATNTSFRGTSILGGSTRRLWDGILLAYAAARIRLDSCTITDILTDSVSLHGSALTLFAASDTSNRIKDCRIARSVPADSSHAGDGVLLLAYHGAGGKAIRSFLRMENCCVYEYWYTGVANAESDLHMSGCRVFSNLQGLGTVNPAKSHLQGNCITANHSRGILIDNQAKVRLLASSPPSADGMNNISFNGSGGAYQLVEAQVVLLGTSTLNEANLTASNGNNVITHLTSTIKRVHCDTSAVVYALGNWWGIKPDSCIGTFGTLSPMQMDSLFTICNPGSPFIVDSASCDPPDTQLCTGECGDIPGPPMPVLGVWNEPSRRVSASFQKLAPPTTAVLSQALALAADHAQRGDVAGSYGCLDQLLTTSVDDAVASIVAHTLLHLELQQASISADSLTASMTRLAGFLTRHIQMAPSSDRAAALREILAHAFACAGDVPAAEQTVATLRAQHMGSGYATRILRLKQFLCMARWDTTGVDQTIADMVTAGFHSDALHEAGACRVAFLRVLPHQQVFPKLRLPDTAPGTKSSPRSERIILRNYPNPFNPSTIITFSIPEKAHVTLTIYSSMGQLIETLLDEEREAGEHSVVFDADRVLSGSGSGLHFYTLITDGSTKTAGMLLLR